MSHARERLTAPEHLTSEHDVSAFDSRVLVLDDWLKKRALQNELNGASRTYVVCKGSAVVGYYALATGAVAQHEATGRIRRNMPEPIPIMILARLAVDRSQQGKSLGVGLLRDAVMRTLQAAAIGGIRALVVHAISDDARRFYERHGFVASPLDAMTLMVSLADAQLALGLK